MGRLIDGKWTDNDESYRQGGAFVRPATVFRSFITADGSSQFPAEAARYHVYVALPCPWCHRTMIFHALKRLEGVVSISMVDPLMLEGGWRFKQPDPITGAQFVHQLYTLADPRYTGRVSVPVLWDKKTGTIVNNELSDIIRMFNSAFDDVTGERTDYYPAAFRSEIDAINKRVYKTLNNGVYRCGFATNQQVYDQAVTELFDTLDWLETRLGKKRYLSALQLHFLFEVCAPRFGLVCAPPERPCDDVGGLDAPLCELDGDAADFLDRPADQECLVRRRGSVFLGGVTFAWWRMTAIMAKASMTNETWRCQPCQERVSL